MTLTERFRNAETMKKIGAIGLVLTIIGTATGCAGLGLNIFKGSPSTPGKVITADSGISAETITNSPVRVNNSRTDNSVRTNGPAHIDNSVGTNSPTHIDNSIHTNDPTRVDRSVRTNSGTHIDKRRTNNHTRIDDTVHIGDLLSGNGGDVSITNGSGTQTIGDGNQVHVDHD